MPKYIVPFLCLFHELEKCIIKKWNQLSTLERFPKFCRIVPLLCLFRELEVAVEADAAESAEDSQQLVAGDGVAEEVEPAQQRDTELTVPHHVVTDDHILRVKVRNWRMHFNLLIVLLLP